MYILLHSKTNYMNYKNNAIRDVKKEFENNSTDILIEEISKLRKIVNGLTFSIDKAISDLNRKHSDGSIALDYLEKNYKLSKLPTKDVSLNKIDNKILDKILNGRSIENILNGSFSNKKLMAIW